MCPCAEPGLQHTCACGSLCAMCCIRIATCILSASLLSAPSRLAVHLGRPPCSISMQLSEELLAMLQSTAARGSCSCGGDAWEASMLTRTYTDRQPCSKSPMAVQPSAELLAGLQQRGCKPCRFAAAAVLLAMPAC